MRKLLLQNLLLLFTTSLWGQTTFAKKYTDSLPQTMLAVHIEKGTYDDIFLGSITGQKTIISHLNSSGDTIWSKKYTCPSCPYNWLSINSFTKCRDGGFALVGKNYLGPTTYDMFIT